MLADFPYVVNPDDVELLNFDWGKVHFTLSPEVNGATRLARAWCWFSPIRAMRATIIRAPRRSSTLFPELASRWSKTRAAIRS